MGNLFNKIWYNDGIVYFFKIPDQYEDLRLDEYFSLKVFEAFPQFYNLITRGFLTTTQYRKFHEILLNEHISLWTSAYGNVSVYALHNSIYPIKNSFNHYLAVKSAIKVLGNPFRFVGNILQSYYDQFVVNIFGE